MEKKKLRPERAEKWLTEPGLARLRSWAAAGLSMRELAHNMGIGETTLRRWRQCCPELEAAIRHGRAVAEYQVEEAMLQSATGYEAKEYEKTTRGDYTEYREETRHIEGSTAAQSSWLRRLNPEKWGE